MNDESDPHPSGRTLRFGLVGTGHWASIVHAPALASVPGIELSAVWGRDPLAAGGLARAHGASAHSDFGTFLADVDGVAFCVPPDVQSALALQAANSGKHLLLEKPVSTSEDGAAALAQAVDDAQVASVVFFTARFQRDVRAWLADVTSKNWMGAGATWLGLLTRLKFSVVFAQSVAPFLPCDAVKILAATACVSILGSFGNDSRDRIL